MGKTWQNYPCTFRTANTENGNGDSQYTVTRDSVKRHAPINEKRAPDQVHQSHGSIAYLDAKSDLYREIMQEPDDGKVTVAGADGDRIFISLKRGPIEPLIAECSRKPANGLCTFDFNNRDGVLSHIHVGHKIYDLKMT